MAKPNTIPSDEIERLSAETMDATIKILQALADSDRKEALSAWKQNVFIINLRHKLTGNVGTTSGSMTLPVPTYPTATRSFNSTPVAKSFSVST